LRSYRISDANDAETHFLARYRQFQFVCHHLHAVKVLLYAESMGVVIFGHVTKMAVKLLDTPCPKTPCYTQTTRLYLLYNRIHCRLKFYIAGKWNWRIFAKKLVENIEIFRSCRKSDADNAEAHFLAHC